MVSRTGDLWLLGRYRLACGDHTDPETFAAALGGVTPHLMVSDRMQRVRLRTPTDCQVREGMSEQGQRALRLAASVAAALPR